MECPPRLQIPTEIRECLAVMSYVAILQFLAHCRQWISVDSKMLKVNRYQHVVTDRFLSCFLCIILTSLSSTSRLYWDRQKPANWTQWQIPRDLLHASKHRHYNMAWPMLNQSASLAGASGNTQIVSELLIWSKRNKQSWREPSVSWSQTILTCTLAF